jgi:hypothetical protein
VHSEEITGIYGKLVEVSSTEGSTDHGIYYGLGYNPSSPNLLIGGINQESQDPDLNRESYRIVADNNQAIYVPTYYAGEEYRNSVEVNKAASNPQILLGEDSTRTVLNGLISPALNDKKYGTIIAYSGGTASVVTAMAEQGVTADTLILISPIRGGGEVADWIPAKFLTGFEQSSEDPNFAGDDWAEWFEQRIQTIMDRGTNIVVIQSKKDTPKFGDLYQYRFTEDEWPGVTIKTVDLKNSGDAGHLELLTDHATLINNGVYVEPGKQSSSPPQKKELAALAFLGLGAPLLSPSTSGISWSSDQNKDGADVPKTSDASETSGVLYTDKRDNVWYIDIDFKGFQNLLWKDYNPDRNFYLRPPAPMYLPSGERNTYGYNFINLPGMEGNFGSDFINWVNTYLASIGSPGPSAGYGLLIDEGPNGGGGW